MTKVFEIPWGLLKFCAVTAPLIFVGLLFPGPAYTWDLVKEEEGIRIFTKSVNGSNFKAYRATMLLETSIERLEALVKNIKEYPSWVETCKEGRLLKEVGSDAYYAYTANDAPWPVSDRDAVVLNSVNRDSQSGTVTIKITAVPGYITERRDHVRVRHIEGYWCFKPRGKNRVEVAYEVHSEPGGNLPAWLVNSIVVSQPLNTLKNMRKKAED